VVDAARQQEVLLTGVLAGPLLAAIGATAAGVAVVAAYAIALSFVLGVVDDVFLTSDHIVRIVVVIVASIIAVLSAWIRERRERELEETRPQALDAQRLRLALDAGEMGTWTWDLASERVAWDERLEALFGLAPGGFDGTFEMYESLLHEGDRARVVRAVRDGMAHDLSWRFDHRVVWPDGTVHWLEGRGEPVKDGTGTITGAAGVTINVDRRHSLLEAETEARETAERASALVSRLAEITTALAGAATVAEVGDVIVHKGAEALRARQGYFATVDEQTHQLVMRAQAGYSDRVVAKYGRVDLDADLPPAEVMRTGKPLYSTDDPVRGAFAVLPLPPTDGARAVLAFGFGEPRKFANDERTYLNAVVEACAQALQRATAFEAEQDALARLRVLLDSSEQLGALDDPALVAETIADLAATRIGTWATVVRVMPNGTFERVATAHRDPSLAPVVAAVTERLNDTGTALARVIETGEATLWNGLTERVDNLLASDDALRNDLERIGCATFLLVPITIAGRNLAVLSIGDDAPGRLRAADVELAIDLGRRGASGLERASLWQASRERLEAEHRIVELLQRSIIPDHLPELPGARVAAAYRPAEVDVDIGGDWYDAFVAPDGAIVLVVGDVAGHGIQAASLMGRVRNALRAYAVEDTDPASILVRLHALLRTQDEAEMVTAFVARYDSACNEMTWSRAGHPPPLVVQPDGSARFLEDVNGAPLGAMARPYRTASVAMPAGSLLVCYTDGLVERRDRILDEGLAWLSMRVRQHRDDELETLCDKLVDDPFVPHPAPDDVCVLALRTFDA
jgi:serine phosphatase RsbU (regulator of sigma subunit)/PAS domain-containing protein